MYFFDLAGAAGGCLLLVPLLNTFGGPNTVIAAAVLFAASSAIWFNQAQRAAARALGVTTGLALVAILAVNIKARFIDVTYAKGQELRHEMFVKWNSFSRIAVAPEKGSNMLSIIIDADAATGIATFDFEHLTAADREALLYQGAGFPYVLRPGAKTLIIGPGGGWDVCRALASGSRSITGVEINPIIATTVMRQKYATVSRNLYFRPEVSIVVEDGRSFVRRTSEKFQVMQATLVDTWASTAAGAFALSENNLYTTDAFEDYLSHLTDDGILAFTRWGFDPPRESLRLLSLAIEALDRHGEKEPWRHVMVAREGSAQELAGWGTRDTVLISRKPFSDEDISRARETIARSRMQAVYLPGDSGGNAFAELLRSDNPGTFQSTYRYDISPVNDDRPFFFYTVQPRDLWNFVTEASRRSADYKINRAVPLLFSLVAVSLVATAVILLLPPLLLGSRLPRERGAAGLLLYFVFVGVGYILIQVALIQKFVLLLGHPTYALTVIVFSMLISSGLGSYWSRRVVAGSGKRLAWVLAAVSILVVELALVTPYLTDACVAYPLWLKEAITVLFIAPAGFAMGMPFPMGLARLEQRYRSAVRWAWSLNAAASVLGSACAIFFAIYLGLRATLLIGWLMYVCALGSLALHRNDRKPLPDPVPAAFV